MASKTGVILSYNFNLSKKDNLAYLKETFKRVFPKRNTDRYHFDEFWRPLQKDFSYMYLFTSMYFPDFMTKSEYKENLDREDLYIDNRIYVGEIK